MKASKIPLKKRLALELFRKYRKNSKQLHQLDYIFWECTLRCNLNCIHCGSDCKKETSVKDMPLSDFIAAIDDIRDIVEPNKTMIVFTGGEPLVRNDLEVCGKQLYDRGFPWGIVTNGLHLTGDRLKTLYASGLRAVTISLDGLKDSHNWLRGNPASFNRAIAAIGSLVAYPDLRFDVVTCANRRNFYELFGVRDLLLEKGVKEWRIFTIFPIGRAKHEEELQLSPSQFKELFDFIASVRKEGKIKLNYGCEGFLGRYEGDVRDNLFFCRAGITVASVLVDGSLSACPNIRDNFTQGNIYNDSFREVWENRYEVFRNRDWMKNGICSECNLFKYCDGGGVHLREGKEAEIMFCHHHRIQEGGEVT